MFSSTATLLNPFTSFIYDHNHLSIPPLSDPNYLPPTPNIPIISNQFINGDPHASSVSDKRPRRKDRHTKIHTAQGLRDRRVRLSIEISRKFFDLQDMLGFDKASKTLDWLLTQSRKSIEELAQNHKNHHNSTFEEVVSELEDGNVVKKIKNLKKKDATLPSSSPSFNLVAAKKLREKARERARERTRVKLLCTSSSAFNLDPTFQTLNQSRSRSSISGCYSSYTHNYSNTPSSTSFKVVAHHQAEEPNQNIIEESIVIKRKLMGSYQQNLFMFKDANSNNYNSNFPNLAPNGDINSAIAHSSLCTINNTNRSTGLHLYGKLREADNNECYTNMIARS